MCLGLAANSGHMALMWTHALLLGAWRTFPFVDRFLLCHVMSSAMARCRNPTLREVWGRHSHSRKWELESSGTPKNSEDHCRGQNALHWGFFYTVGKVLKFRCPKWHRMSHLDICSPSYGEKKGRESNCQFDSRPLKVGNQPNLTLAGGVQHGFGKLSRRATSLV
jgi:hypothetical protein